MFFTACTAVDMNSIKYVSYEIDCCDFLDIVSDKITFEQMFSRTEQIVH